MKYLLRPIALVLISLVTFSAKAVNSEECKLNKTFTQQDEDKQLRKVLYDDKFVFFSEGMHVNTDGNFQSYNIDDPMANKCKGDETVDEAVQKHCAMNTLWNGMEIFYPNGKKVPYKEFEGEFNELKNAIWRPKSGYAVNWIAVETMENKGKNKPVTQMPCVKENNYVVSTTSTRLNLSPEYSCKQERYLDSKIPSIVVPTCWTEDGRKSNKCKKLFPQGPPVMVMSGDFIAMMRQSDSKIEFAVIGDTGPVGSLGEASYGMMMKMKGNSKIPVNLKQTYDLDDSESKYSVLVIRNSATNRAITVANQDELLKLSQEKFLAEFQSQQTLISMLSACAKMTF